MENTKEESWLDAFRQKYCHYVPGAPGSFQLNDKVTAVSIEIFIQILLSKEKARIREEVEKMKVEIQIKDRIGENFVLVFKEGFNQCLEDIKDILK